MEARVDLGRLAWPALVVGLATILGALAGLEPDLAVAVALGFGFVIVVLADLTAGLALFTAIAFLELLPVEGVALSTAKLAGLLLALSWFATFATGREGRADFFSAHPTASLALLGFVGWAAISALWAEQPDNAIETAWRFGLNALLFVIVYTAVQKPRDVHWVLTGFLVGASIAAVYGIIAVPAPEADGRVAGTIGDPNELALVLLAGLVLGVACLLAPLRAPGLRLVAAVAAPLCLVGYLLTASRGGLVALAVALLAAIVVAGRWRARVAVLACSAAVVIAWYYAAAAPDETRERIESAAVGQTRVLEGRTTIWEIGSRMFEANPVIGVGAGNFPVASVHYLLEPGAVFRTDQIVDEPSVAHNAYLEVAAELGIVGLAALLAVIGFSLASGLRAARQFAESGDTAMEILARAVVVAVIAILAGLVFLSDQYSKQLWLLLGLGPAMLAIAAARRRDSTAGVEPGAR